MYPETDIPPFTVAEELLKRLLPEVPEGWEAQVRLLEQRYGLSRKLATQIYDSEHLTLFERAVSSYQFPPTFVAAFLTETLVALSREGLSSEKLTEEVLLQLFAAVHRAQVSKEAAPDVMRIILKGEAKTVEEAIQKLGFTPLSDQELSQIIEETINAHLSVVEERGERAHGFIMGRVMERVRGRVDGSKVNAMVSAKLRELRGRKKVDP